MYYHMPAQKLPQINTLFIQLALNLCKFFSKYLKVNFRMIKVKTVTRGLRQVFLITVVIKCARV